MLTSKSKKQAGQLALTQSFDVPSMQGQPLVDCFQSGPALHLQTYTFNRKCLCSASTGPTVFFKCGARYHQKFKRTALFL